MKKKILLLHQGGDLYGSDKVFLTLVKILSEKYEPTIVVDYRGPLIKEMRPFSKKVAIKKLGVLRRKKKKVKIVTEFLRSLPYLIKLINRYNPQFVVTNTSVVLSGALIAALKGVSHIWFIHEEPKSILEKKALKKTVNLLSAKIVVPSESVKRWVGKDAIVIPYVENIKKSRFKVRNFSTSKNRVLLGCVGMLHPKKGQDYLIEVFEKVVREKKNVKLLIIGGEVKGYEKYKKKLLAMIKNAGLDKQIKLLGYKKEIIPYIKQLDVVVIPSQYEEPFPLVAQEAMYLGKPILATRVGGLKEFVKPQKNGLFIPQDDSKKAAEVILKLLKDRNKIKKMGKESKRLYEKRFSYFEFKKQILSLFN